MHAEVRQELQHFRALSLSITSRLEFKWIAKWSNVDDQWRKEGVR